MVMTKEEIYKASDVLNTILDNYLHGGETAEVVTKFEDELIKSNLTKEEPTIPDIVDEHFYEMLGEEPVSDGLEEVAHQYYKPKETFMDGFKKGAKWQKAKLWKPADGDDLPEYDREVIAILDYDFGHYKVVYAHRPNPNGWNGTNIDTGEKEHFEPEIYDKGGWNQPHVLYWLDARLPYEENDKEIEL